MAVDFFWGLYDKTNTSVAMRLRLAPLSWVAFGLCLTASSWAESDISEPADPNALGEVIVTARRVAENLQRVPVATTVVDAATLEKLQIRRASDLQFSAPSLTIVPDPLGGSVLYRCFNCAD